MRLRRTALGGSCPRGSRATELTPFIQRSGVRWLIAAVLVYGTLYLVCDTAVNVELNEVDGDFYI
jgi:hypothetical protein